MSLFHLPRIHVRGTHFFNPGTGNNNCASPGTGLTYTSDSQRVRAAAQGMTDAQFRQWMTGLDGFGLLRAQWNYFGDMTFRFMEVNVSSVQLEYGKVITDPAKDALIGGQVSLNNATLIDSNPEGFHTTQVFASGVQLTAPAAIGGSGSYVSRPPTRGTTRWLNWFRNVSYHGLFGLPPTGVDGQISSGGAGGASAAFSVGMETRPEDLLADGGVAATADDEMFHKFLPKAGSPAMQALAAALQDGDRVRGLMFRFNLYLCFPNYSDTELAVRFAKGELTENPAYGQLVGTIAPWLRDEPSTISLGRYLKPATSYPNPYRQGKAYYLSPAIASYDAAAKVVSLELSNCLPEDGPAGEKFDLGTVTVGVRQATAPNQDPSANTAVITPIGTITNTRQAYQDGGGMCDLSTAKLPKADQAKLDDNGYEIVLTSSKFGTLLYETEYFAVTDCECSYLDELPPGQSWDNPANRPVVHPHTPPGLRGEIDLWVRQRGKIPAQPVTLTIEQWRETPTVAAQAAEGGYLYPLLLHSEGITVSGGKGSYTLKPLDGSGLRLFRIIPQGVWPQFMAPDVFSNLQAQEFYFDLRVLPYDDYSKVTDAQLTFDFVYAEALRYYHLIMPAMSKRLDMSDPTIWNTPTAAQYVLRMCDERMWATPNYMPRTRDLSKYRRALLRRFCEKVLRQGGIVSPTPTSNPHA
ncbi:MAG: hypothetical protein ACKVY0_15455 [Prosthecobacter sp.]|uniref:hypothetical protein n=1 Tax=Prosthecobacter sp. TaxID=1965333 RepID=UPI0039035989